MKIGFSLMAWLKYSLLTAAILLIFTGCWDRIEVEEQAYVVNIGLDKGEGNSVEVTFEIANPEATGPKAAAAGDKEQKSEVLTLRAPDIISAREMAGVSVAKRPTLTQARNLIVSEEIAKTENFFTLIREAVRDKEINRDVFLIISQGKAAEFIRKNKPQLETRAHKFYDLMARRWRETGYVPISTIHRYLRSAEGEEDLFLGVYGTTEKSLPKENGREADYLAGQVDKEGGNETQMIGSAVFREGKMVGKLTGEETRLAHLMQPIFSNSSMFVTFRDPISEEHRITARLVKHEKTKARVNIRSGKTEINVEAPVIIDVLTISSKIDYIEDLTKQKILKKSIEDELNNQAASLISKTQNELKGDPFFWSLDARKKFWTWKDFKNFSWKKNYPNAKVLVSFNVTIRGFGKQTKPS